MTKNRDQSSIVYPDWYIDSVWILQAMIDHRLKKREGWEYRLIDKFPPVATLKETTILGSWTWTQMGSKRRFIYSHVAHDIGAGFVPPSDIARDYLDTKYGDTKRRCTTHQYLSLVKNRKSAPMYAVPCTIPDAVYVDLTSAYWQIVMAGGWDVDYSQGRYIGVNSDNRDFPVPDIKLARNSLVSMGLPSSMTMYTPGKGIYSVRAGSNYINTILWGFAMDVLHGFASDMLEQCGAVYIHTDGYIIDREMYDTALSVAESWGLHLSIRHEGRATVRGVGDYDLGKRKSKRPRRYPRPHEYIHPAYKRWLRRSFKKLSRRIDLDTRRPDVSISRYTDAI